MKETVSQQWKREYFATQQELNAATQEVANFVDDFNREVQQMYSSGRSTPDIRSTIDRHIMMLDGMWPYHGQSLHVSGKWIGSTVHVENGIDSFSARSIPEEKEVFERALSAGFGVQLKDGYPKCGYYFYLEKDFEEEENAQGVVGLNSYSWGSLGIQYRPAYLAFPSDVTLHPDDNIATPATDLDEVHTGLELAQAQYQLYTRHRSRLTRRLLLAAHYRLRPAGQPDSLSVRPVLLAKLRDDRVVAHQLSGYALGHQH